MFTRPQMGERSALRRGPEISIQATFVGDAIARVVVDQAQRSSAHREPTFEMTRGIPARVEWINDIATPYFLPVDPTLHWANPNGFPAPTGDFLAFPGGYVDAQKTVPYVTHVHGLEVSPLFDGAPGAWFTRGAEKTGPDYDYGKNIADYPNSQPATALWYHDHALGVTRLNVYAGLAGMYIIRDPKNSVEHPPNCVPVLPDAAHEMPLVIQDRSFNSDGTLAYVNSGDNPAVHPYWSSYFAGDFNVVNGKVWPDMPVDRAVYRFRILNGANNRAYNLYFPDDREFTVIGSDGGFLPAKTTTKTLTLAPAERADVLVDFTGLAKGSSVILTDTDQSEVVRFTVKADALDVPRPAELPSPLNDLVPLTPNADKRTVTLNAGDDGSYLLNGQMFDSPVTETPRVGSTEDWDIVNLSGMDHPIHLHLVQFRILQRQAFNDGDYASEWTRRNGPTPLSQPTQTLDAGPYLTGERVLPAPAEAGWKDTAIATGGMVTTLRVRWAPEEAPPETAPGRNAFGFDPTAKPGYLWHCHMLEHEDNEMMRPLSVQP